MKNPYRIVIALTVIAITIISCGGKGDSTIAGKGGSETLTLLPQHHGLSRNIDTCKVYIKYNTTDQPLAYDDSATCICADTVVSCHFSGLQKGNYYVYGYGFDSSIQKNVKGGIPISITQQNTTTVIYLPVSED